MSFAETRMSFERPEDAAGREPAVLDDLRPPAAGKRASGLEAALHFPELDDWEGIFDRLAMSGLMRTHIATRARINGVPLLQELHASGIVLEAALFRALADELGVGYVESIDPEKLVIRDSDSVALLGRKPGAAPVGLRENVAMNVVAATERLDVPALKHRLMRASELKQRLRIAPPSALRKALFERARATLCQRAVNRLWETQPDCSARFVLNLWQSFLLGAFAVALPLAVVSHPASTFFGFHLVSSFIFIACIGLRFAAIPAVAGSQPFVAKPMAAEDMPVYSVLVALYKEAEIVPQLLVALGNIVWPRCKLEIKLVCEEDDHATLTAIRAQALRPWVEVIEVPVFGPRTKPKALAYALPAVSGDYVVLYDAEDRPHQLQLIEAWQRFEASDGSLACVQAPLEVTNGHRSIVARMFAFEYAALFRGLLPWLSGQRLLLPLGGTSNHFRRSVLEEVGGWDPHNVTEDADLGLRLARFGYRTETISSPTYEDGPEDFATWRRQRSRWFKGWAQTWLVHMRYPLRLKRELGFRSFAIAQILFAGMLASAFLHPLLVASAVFLAVNLVLERVSGTGQSIMLGLDIASICLGYLSFLLLGWKTLSEKERRGFWRVLLFMPVYWLMMSVAAWHALWQLYRDPHHWEKTPHHRSAARRRAAP